MAAPGITRHRRPFLAPLWLSLLAALVLAGIAWAFYHDATTTVVFLVRVADTFYFEMKLRPVRHRRRAGAYVHTINP